MKRKLALLVAAVMAVGTLPMTAFASTTNSVSKIPSIETDDYFESTIVLKEFEGTLVINEPQTIKITLTNAEWDTETTATPGQMTFGVADSNGVTWTKLSDNQAMAEFDVTVAPPVPDTYLQNLKMFCKATDTGDATATIEDVDSVVSAQTIKLANVAGGATTTTISGTTSIRDAATDIKNIVITETTAGTIDAGQVKLRLSNGFKYSVAPAVGDVIIFPTGCGLTVTGTALENDGQDLMITFAGSSTTAATISVSNLKVYYDDDDASVGDECSVTVSGAGTTKESVVVGTATDYGVAFTIYKDEELPAFYSGTYDEDTDTLIVKIKENINGSWLNRKTKIVFPEGVEIVDYTQDGIKNMSAPTYSIDENEMTLTNIVTTGKGELRLKFNLSVAPDFVGDITATLTGSAVGDDQELTVGEAKFPVTVAADVNELMIDYRNTKASDITITEVDAGVLKKDTTFSLAIDGIAFDGDPTVEVTDGDLKIETVKVTDDMLTFKVKTESQKTAGVIKVSGINLYMERSLPAGEYDLQIMAATKKNDSPLEATLNTGVAEHKNDVLKDLSDNAIIRNYNEKDENDGVFDVSKVTVVKGYVTIVTAGRDQDDSTFTTKVTVTIGADTMTAGTATIALDVPAYIADGYTMLPVRAVTEALSGSAIVRWDDATKTVTITFGQRVVNMTVGSNVMVINGVNVAMQAKCEITDSRAFIPLRDLGYALGLNDSKIAWDDATKTATLN